MKLKPSPNNQSTRIKTNRYYYFESLQKKTDAWEHRQGL